MLSWIIGIIALLIIIGFIRREKRRNRQLSRIYLEDALKFIYHQNEMNKPASLDGLKGVLSISMTKVHHILSDLQRQKLIRLSERGVELLEGGRRLVMEIIRAHRIWETYLQQETDLPMHEIHSNADHKEHEIRGEKLDALDAHLGFPAFDPHGDPIPTADGQLNPLQAQSLTDWPLGKEGQIVHIEDEPASIAKTIFQKGIRLHDRIKVLRNEDGQLQLQHKGKEYRMDGVTAANIQVTAGKEGGAVRRRTLIDLQPGEMARIKGLSPHVQGLARRRLLDLGFTPGVPVRKVLVSSFGGDPTAYQVRGAKIALRRDQGEHIYIE